MAFVFTGDNPSQLYLEAQDEILTSGDNVAPRGKRVLEIRPVLFEFTNPLHRVTFLRGRLINPFFQLAEAIWILQGRADVKFLTDYNASIAQFSDDGKYFNAPYGQRLREYNVNSMLGTEDIFNNSHHICIVDQLTDVYTKLRNDVDTRQAVAVIYNPAFDHADVITKDRPCNISLMFKIRNNKLDLTVTNRSNDLHWGLFGANLVQFTTILEVMANWLGVEVGTYNHFTDSLHIYLDDYGAQCTEEIRKNNENILEAEEHYWYFHEPRMCSNYEQFHRVLNDFFAVINSKFNNPYYTHTEMLQSCDTSDPYFTMTFQAMLAYREHKRGQGLMCIDTLDHIEDCSWKVSCLRFLSSKYIGTELSDKFINLYDHYPQQIKDYIERTGE